MKKVFYFFIVGKRKLQQIEKKNRKYFTLLLYLTAGYKQLLLSFFMII